MPALASEGREPPGRRLTACSSWNTTDRDPSRPHGSELRGAIVGQYPAARPAEPDKRAGQGRARDVIRCVALARIRNSDSEDEPGPAGGSFKGHTGRIREQRTVRDAGLYTDEPLRSRARCCAIWSAFHTFVHKH